MIKARRVRGHGHGRSTVGLTVGAAAALSLASGCGSDATVLGNGLGASPGYELSPGAVPGAPEGVVFTPFEEYRDRAELEVGGELVYRVEWDLFFETEEQLLEHYLTQVKLISKRGAARASRTRPSR